VEAVAEADLPTADAGGDGELVCEMGLPTAWTRFWRFRYECSDASEAWYDRHRACAECLAERKDPVFLALAGACCVVVVFVLYRLCTCRKRRRRAREKRRRAQEAREAAEAEAAEAAAAAAAAERDREEKAAQRRLEEGDDAERWAAGAQGAARVPGAADARPADIEMIAVGVAHEIDDGARMRGLAAAGLAYDLSAPRGGHALARGAPVVPPTPMQGAAPRVRSPVARVGARRRSSDREEDDQGTWTGGGGAHAARGSLSRYGRGGAGQQEESDIDILALAPAPLGPGFTEDAAARLYMEEGFAVTGGGTGDRSRGWEGKRGGRGGSGK
jgi:hypothetical protein